jgi:hypothetical protein
MFYRKLIALFVIFNVILFLEGAYLHFHQVALQPLRRPASITDQIIETSVKAMKPFRRHELIAQHDGDMGDTLQRTGSYYTLLKYLELPQDDLGRPLALGFELDLQKLSAGPGKYRRSNRPGNWSANPENCSRDQMMALHSALIVYKDTERARELFAAFAQRFFFNQNIRHNDAYPGQESYRWKFPDPPSPMQLSLMLRGLDEWWVYPAVFTLDMAILLDMTVLRRLDGRQLWDTDIKAVPTIIAANSYLPTPWSKLAMILYVDQKPDVENRIRYYNEVRFNGIAPLADLYVFSLEKLQQPQTDFQQILALSGANGRQNQSPRN